jgi:hypothetical protein
MTILLIPPLVAPTGTLAYEWIDPNGVVRSLSDRGRVFVQTGARGLGMPAPDLVTDKLPFDAGMIDRHAAIPARVIELPLFVQAASGPDLEALMDDVHGWFYTADEQRRRPGALRVTRRDGTRRQIACYYTGGLEGDLSQSEAGVYWQRMTVELTAVDPWATAIEDTTVTYTIGTAAQFTVINEGQLDAYPRWTINGPLISMTFANHTTERSWTLNMTLAAGESVTIDARPASQRTAPQVVDSDGANQRASLTASSDLWALAPANNAIDVALANGGIATTIELAYLPRYRSLLR